MLLFHVAVGLGNFFIQGVYLHGSRGVAAHHVLPPVAVAVWPVSDVGSGTALAILGGQVKGGVGDASAIALCHIAIGIVGIAGGFGAADRTHRMRLGVAIGTGKRRGAIGVTEVVGIYSRFHLGKNIAQSVITHVQGAYIAVTADTTTEVGICSCETIDTVVGEGFRKALGIIGTKGNIADQVKIHIDVLDQVTKAAFAGDNGIGSASGIIGTGRLHTVAKVLHSDLTPGVH